MGCGFHHLLSVCLQPRHVFGARVIPMHVRLFSSRIGPPVLSLDVTIAPHEADINSHLFLLLPSVALQDSEYQFVLGNATQFESDRLWVVDVGRNDQYSRGCVVLSSRSKHLSVSSAYLARPFWRVVLVSQTISLC
ncbi:hypothetical protein ARMGADRAFT_823368 [Armillaria gallica]|uniref:Uncharacterized protein n=1 Tax=Armillaria gallica TaxID=47427 RepID=A0A2H3CXH2_ARMGA|nr:hypothetical protein ARMGADRAFT_823368 [Armillaria gallica]